jgi:hypothetical protein
MLGEAVAWQEKLQDVAAVLDADSVLAQERRNFVDLESRVVRVADVGEGVDASTESIRGYSGATPGGNCAPSFSSRFESAWIRPRSVPARITIDSAARETSKLSPSSTTEDAGATAELPRSILISVGANDASADDATSVPSIAASPLDRSRTASIATSPALALKRICGAATPALLII